MSCIYVTQQVCTFPFVCAYCMMYYIIQTKVRILARLQSLHSKNREGTKQTHLNEMQHFLKVFEVIITYMFSLTFFLSHCNYDFPLCHNHMHIYVIHIYIMHWCMLYSRTRSEEIWWTHFLLTLFHVEHNHDHGQ